VLGDVARAAAAESQDMTRMQGHSILRHTRLFTTETTEDTEDGDGDH